jgi:hypothetical protein
LGATRRSPPSSLHTDGGVTGIGEVESYPLFDGPGLGFALDDAKVVRYRTAP